MNEWVFPGDQPSIDALLRLVKRLHTGSVCMLAGAGVAVRAGFPTWAGVLDELGEELRPTEPPELLDLLAAQKDNLWRAEEYRIKLTASAYCQFLQQRFAPKDSSVRPELLSLVRLNCKHFFTTNYDVSLEDAYKAAFGRPAVELDWTDRDAVRVFLSKLDEPTRRHFVHLHGRYDKPDEIIFTYRDYVRRYIQADEMVQKLFVLFATQSFVFIGFSLEDPDFVHILRQVNSRLGRGETPAHFAILPLRDPGELSVERRRLQGKYDVDPIFYRMEQAECHMNLVHVISDLGKLQDQPDYSGVPFPQSESSDKLP
jgi:hypothetical protein